MQNQLDVLLGRTLFLLARRRTAAQNR
jgi:hypothetical protein